VNLGFCIRRLHSHRSTAENTAFLPLIAMDPPIIEIG